MYSISPQREHGGSGVRGWCERVADCPAKRMLGSLMASPSRNFFSAKGLPSSCSVTVGTSRKTMLPPSVPRAALSPEATRWTTVICERLSRPVALSKSRRLGSWKLRAPSRWAQPLWWTISQRWRLLSSSRVRRWPWPGWRCIWVLVAMSRCGRVNSTPGGTIDLDGSRPGAAGHDAKLRVEGQGAGRAGWGSHAPRSWGRRGAPALAFRAAGGSSA